MKLIRFSEAFTQKWSGGTTTELFIYPSDSSFSKGDFKLRISLATVEKPETVFTPLPNTKRTLLVLEGAQLLKHEGNHTANLKALEQDTFSGDWTTYCEGTSTNFNVMTKGNESAKVEPMAIAAGAKLNIDSSAAVTFIYLIEGQAECNKLIIKPKEAVSIEAPTVLTFPQASQIVIVTYPVVL